jgi:prophage regulatory protein
MDMHHLVSASEIADMLKISRQRVDQIAKSDPSFPKPTAILSGIRVWDTADIEKWARRTGRLK